MNQQVCVIHGGTSFDSYDEYLEFIKTRELTLDRLRDHYDWKASLQQQLGSDFDVLHPRMPNGTNARYKEWKLWFERCCQLLDDDVILIGHSLGGAFLVKYLSEDACVKTIKATILVAAPFEDVSTEESLEDFMFPSSLEKFAEQGGTIVIVASKDDPIVPFAEVAKFQQALPEARQLVFEDRGHFNQEQFPELVVLVQEL